MHILHRGWWFAYPLFLVHSTVEQSLSLHPCWLSPSLLIFWPYCRFAGSRLKAVKITSVILIRNPFRYIVTCFLKLRTYIVESVPGFKFSSRKPKSVSPSRYDPVSIPDQDKVFFPHYYEYGKWWFLLFNLVGWIFFFFWSLCKYSNAEYWACFEAVGPKSRHCGNRFRVDRGNGQTG